MKKTSTAINLLIFLFSCISLISCKEKGEEIEPEITLTQQINTWIAQTMGAVYLWNDQLPATVDINQDPSDFFGGLLYSGDRFSVIFPDYQILDNALSGISLESGYEFTLIKTTEDAVLAIVTYIKKNSPADKVGLKRGDRISRINNTDMNANNYQEVLSLISEKHTVNYSRYDEDTESYITQDSIDLEVIQLNENPNFLDTTYNIAGKKIGYYVYNFFSPGVENEIYDNQMNAIIQGFKSENITDLVLDLRYNSGGFISSATNLASLIGTDINTNDIFYQSIYNELYQAYYEGLDDGDERLRKRFLDKPENIGQLIAGNIYVLVGPSTASASELVINGLNPFMNVTLIGQPTVGKNVGSQLYKDDEDTENKYGILPIVLFLSNSLDEADYENGFIPAPENTINELAAPFVPMGDIRDPLLGHAIEIITGGSIVARKRPFSEASDITAIGSSLDRKAYSNRAIFDGLVE